jgi:hypothetical protein
LLFGSEVDSVTVHFSFFSDENNELKLLRLANNDQNKTSSSIHSIASFCKVIGCMPQLKMSQGREERQLNNIQKSQQLNVKIDTIFKVTNDARQE